MPLQSLRSFIGDGIRKRLYPVLLVVGCGVAFGLIAIGIGRLTGLTTWVPSASPPVVSQSLGSETVLFLVSFACSVLACVCLLLYRANRASIDAHWRQYSTWAQSVIVGCLCAVVAALALSSLTLVTELTATAVVLTFLVTWPLAAGLLLLQDRRSTTADSSFSSVRTGYAHTKGLESRTLSVIVGFSVGVAGGVGLWYGGTWYSGHVPLAVTVTAALVLWVGTTIVVYNRYAAATSARTELTIVALRTPDSRSTRELAIRNDSASAIDLSESRIRDTEFDLYRLGVNITLKPGAVCSFEIPESFSTEPNDDSVALPLGYSLKRGGETPTLLTKTGTIYSLQWSATAPTDEGEPTTGRSEPMSDTATNSVERETDPAAGNSEAEPPVAGTAPRE
ncbi:hypothetical protein [Natrialba sp. SSL1]|uniref:hypothetical protein n=1 Tax=Natrialba sp. SSL1 TaxID=1869245 RepID=UPI0008F80712|nr:hypothetical protein [Natrialba sp. SSL1]OIB58996.1 hypothetical protein BBD46_05685 [Natrialba sp. SSL1]